VRPGTYKVLAGLCAERAGLSLNEGTAGLAESRLAPLARREAFGSVDDLLTAVGDREDPKLVWRVVEAMSPAPSAFFSEPAALDHLCDTVLPDLARVSGEERLRVWAAGCGAGQEVYSLAMALEERVLPFAVEIFGSDLSEARLEKAQAGVYSPFEVQRGLSARRLVKCFEKRDEAFLLSPRLRRRIRWGRVNLMEEQTRLGPFDVILCRDILPAFTDVAQARMARTFGAALRPGGRLVLGAAERPFAGDWRAASGPPGAFDPQSAAMLAA
jgi:chemotaxis protein methyltransferase CheR